MKNDKIDLKGNINKYKMRTYSIVYLFPLPNGISVLLSRNLIGITKHKCFLMRNLWSSFYKRHISRNSYHSKK